MSPHVWAGVALAAALGTAVPCARATDRPMAGTSLRVSARDGMPARRRLVFRSRGAAAPTPPFADPTLGARLRIVGAGATDPCRVDTHLDPAHWRPIRGDGPRRGWRYRAEPPAGGLLKIVLRRTRRGGLLLVKMRGEALPCGLETATVLPLRIELSIDGTHHCAAFGGTIRRNEPGRLKAANAPPPTACLDRDLTIANLNVLHGLFCPPATAFCRLTERIDLLAEWIVARGCPDLVALQEVFETTASIPEILAEAVDGICPEPYDLVYFPATGLDDSLVLTRHPVVASQVLDLYGPLRNVLHVRVGHPLGPVDVFSTHLASGSDLATAPCEGTFGTCPPECVDAGAGTVRQCQAVQTALAVERVHDVPGPAFLVGDMNAQPGSFEVTTFTSRGWIDTYAAAGNPECAPDSGVGCTSGRSEPDDLEDPALNLRSRIDYVFLVPTAPGGGCADVLDTPADGDGDGTACRLFAEAPNPFVPACGPPPDPICWISDHTGVEADVNCE